MIELDLPKKVKVGLSASNISAKPFTAKFENFALDQRRDSARRDVQRAGIARGRTEISIGG